MLCYQLASPAIQIGKLLVKSESKLPCKRMMRKSNSSDSQ